MLHRIFSVDARQKTEYFFRKIQKYLSEGKRIVLIVPEQMSVTYEAALASLCPSSSNFLLEVLNFSRLPNRVFRETGGLSFRPVDKTGKLLMLFRALQSLDGELKQLRLRADRPSAVEKIYTQLREFEDFGVSCEQLEELSRLARSEDNLTLSLKLSDLALIQRRYRELMNVSFDDSVSEARRLQEVLAKHRFFEGYYIFIDGFYDFTSDQYALMRRMAVQAEEMYVGLFASQKDLEGEGFSQRAAKAAKKIALMSDRDNLRDLFLPENQRIPPELLHLSRHLFSDRQVYPGACNALHLTRCHSAYDEACRIASAIRRLAKEGTPYSRIAVSFRNDSTYPRLLQAVFSRYEIPFHCAVIESASNAPAARLIRLACRIAAGDLRLETMRKYLKTDLTPLTAEERFLLEDYALTWELSGNLWLREKDLTMPADGYGAKDSEERRQRLKEINRLRRLATAPLLHLREGFRRETLGEKLGALSSFLEELGVRDRLAQKAETLRQEQRFSEADELITLWNTLLESLRQLNATAGDQKAGPREFCDWIRLALSGCQRGTLPPAPDCVQIGEASFMRNTGIEILFVPGLNSGIFPPDDKPTGLLTANERKLFERSSVELSDSQQDSAVNEYFLFDQLLRAPSRALYLSYHEKKTSGSSPCAPSVFVSAIREIYPCLEERFYDPESALPVCREEAFRYYSTHYGEENDLMAVLKEYFDGDPRSLPLKNAKDFANSKQELSRSPYASSPTIGMTQSRLECYTKCRYRFFAEHMLKLSSPPSAYPNVMEEGTLLHGILERFFSDLYAAGERPDALSEEEIDQRILRLCQEAFLVSEEEEGKLRYLVGRAAKSLGYVVRNLILEFSQSQFVPVMFEADLPGKLSPYTISLPDGSRLKLFGKIDRVDLFTSKDGTRYVRVVDYKSSPKSLNLQDVYNGLNQQMLIYLFSLWQSGVPVKNEPLPVLPAGVLYVPSKRPDVSLHKEDPDKLQSELARKMQRHGLVLDNDEVRNAMEKGCAGFFFSKRDPARYLASLEEFSLLQRHTERLLKKAANALKKGKISPDPFRSGCDSCQGCPYRAVCKFEERPSKRYEYFDNRTDVLNAMRKEDDQ